MFEIPLRNDLAAFQISIELDLETFTFKFTWNERSNKWVVGIFSENNEPLLNDVPVYVGWPIFGRFKDKRLPKGNILFFDTSGKNLDPEKEDLGARVIMVYEELADVA
jgi:hypothetical protein